MKFTHTGAEPVIVFGFSGDTVAPGQTIEFTDGPEYPGLADRLAHSATFTPADAEAIEAVRVALLAASIADKIGDARKAAPQTPVTPQKAPGDASSEPASPEVAAAGGAGSEDTHPE